MKIKQQRIEIHALVKQCWQAIYVNRQIQWSMVVCGFYSFYKSSFRRRNVTIAGRCQHELLQVRTRAICIKRESNWLNKHTSLLKIGNGFSPWSKFNCYFVTAECSFHECYNSPSRKWNDVFLSASRYKCTGNTRRILTTLKECIINQDVFSFKNAKQVDIKTKLFSSPEVQNYKNIFNVLKLLGVVTCRLKWSLNVNDLNDDYETLK